MRIASLSLVGVAMAGSDVACGDHRGGNESSYSEARIVEIDVSLYRPHRLHHHSIVCYITIYCEADIKSRKLGIMLTSRLNFHVIRRVYKQDLAMFTSHLVRLDRASRRARFGYTISDESVLTYAERCLAQDAIIYAYFKKDIIYGVGEIQPRSR